MPIISKLNYLRISPRKVRLVADLIRKDKVKHAEQVLNFTVKRASAPIAKLLKAAVADAHNNFHVEAENLYISKIIVNEGPKYKRWRPRSRGLVNRIIKRSSNITLVLEEIAPKEKAEQTKKKKIAEKGTLLVKKEKKKKETGVLKNEKKAIAKNMPGKDEKISSHIREESEEKIKQPKFYPKTQPLKVKPKIERGIKRIFRRKAF